MEAIDLYIIVVYFAVVLGLGFWYRKRASKDLPGITGNVGDIKKGQVRDGGSFLTRSRKYATWNSFFTNNVYQVKKANDFLSA